MYLDNDYCLVHETYAGGGPSNCCSRSLQWRLDWQSPLSRSSLFCWWQAKTAIGISLREWYVTDPNNPVIRIERLSTYFLVNKFVEIEGRNIISGIESSSSAIVAQTAHWVLATKNSLALRLQSKDDKHTFPLIIPRQWRKSQRSMLSSGSVNASDLAFGAAAIGSVTWFWREETSPDLPAWFDYTPHWTFQFFVVMFFAS